MILKVHTRGQARVLSDYFLRHSDNEAVIPRLINFYPFQNVSPRDIRRAAAHMDAQAHSRAVTRFLYHFIIALAPGELLKDDQLTFALKRIAETFDLVGHQFIVVEHRKDGRQHFHAAFSLVHPLSRHVSHIHPLQKRIHLVALAHDLSQSFGFTPVVFQKRSLKKWEFIQGPRLGLSPRLLRQKIASIYRLSTTASDFITALAKAGYVLTKGRHQSLVLVDRLGDIRGLSSCIEHVSLREIQIKLPDLQKALLLDLSTVLNRLRRLSVVEKPIPRTMSGPRQPTPRRNTIWPSVAPLKGPFAAPLTDRQKTCDGTRSLVRRPPAAGVPEELLPLRQPLRPGAGLHNKPKLVGVFKPATPTPSDRQAETQREHAARLKWAFENARYDILAQYGYAVPHRFFGPS